MTQQPYSSAAASLVARTLKENIYCPLPEPGQNDADVNPLCILLNRANIKQASTDFPEFCRSASRLHSAQSSAATSPRLHCQQDSQPTTPLNQSPVLGPRAHFSLSRNSAESLDDLGLHAATPTPGNGSLLKSSSHSTSTAMLRKLSPFSLTASDKDSSSAPLLRIITTENVVIFRGGKDESRGRVLRGTVCLSLHHPLKTKGIQLAFKGVEKVDCYVDGSAFAPVAKHVTETRDLVSHTWTFVRPRSGETTVLPPGAYAWPFEITLPGDLPESVNAPLGQVAYVLRAEIERPTFYFNIVEKKRIIVQRYAIPNESLLLADSVSPPWYTGHHRESNIHYTVQIPNATYSFGEVIPINIRLKNKVCEETAAVGPTEAAASGNLPPGDGQQGLPTPDASMEKMGPLPVDDVRGDGDACEADPIGTKCFLRRLDCYNITATINEYNYYRNPATDQHKRIARITKKTKLPVSREIADTGVFETTAYLQVPQPTSLGESKDIIQDCETRLMKIRHKVKVGIQVQKGELHGTILVTLPITITPATLDNLLADPPMYQEHGCPQEGELVDESTFLTPATSPYLSATTSPDWVALPPPPFSDTLATTRGNRGLNYASAPVSPRSSRENLVVLGKAPELSTSNVARHHRHRTVPGTLRPASLVMTLTSSHDSSTSRLQHSHYQTLDQPPPCYPAAGRLNSGWMLGDDDALNTPPPYHSSTGGHSHYPLACSTSNSSTPQEMNTSSRPSSDSRGAGSQDSPDYFTHPHRNSSDSNHANIVTY